MSEKLKPCPFCGSEAKFEAVGSCVDIHCSKCGNGQSTQKCDLLTMEERGTLSSDMLQYAPEVEQKVLRQCIEAWNNRPREQELEAEIEKLKRQVETLCYGIVNSDFGKYDTDDEQIDAIIERNE